MKMYNKFILVFLGSCIGFIIACAWSSYALHKQLEAQEKNTTERLFMASRNGVQWGITKYIEQYKGECPFSYTKTEMAYSNAFKEVDKTYPKPIMKP